MKNGTQYGKKIKDAYRKFRGAAGDVPDDEPTPPIEELIIACLAEESSIAHARKALTVLNEDMVDFNELRVSTPAEISNSIDKHLPKSVSRARALLRVLNAVYQEEYTVSLDSLQGKGVREVKAYLEKMDGMTPYVSASILLWSLGGHAIPVNEPTLAYLRDANLVHPDAEPGEVQAFLERHISAADAKAFCLDLEAHAQTAGPASKGKSKSAKSRSSKKATKKKTASKKSASRTSTKKKRSKTTTS